MKILHWLLKQLHYLSMGFGLITTVIFICAFVLGNIHDMGISFLIAALFFLIAGSTIKYL